jgi:hypothetical protein
VGDALRLTFADGTTHQIDVDAGLGAATVEQITTGSGEYSAGWIKDGDARWLSLGAIVSIDLKQESDEGPFDPERGFIWA